MTVKSWMQVQEKYIKRYPGNSITDPRNRTPIQTYQAVEDLDRKYPKLKGLYMKNRGERV